MYNKMKTTNTTNKGTNIESNTDEKDNNQIALGLNVLFAVHND